jgi:hypothetical protein
MGSMQKWNNAAAPHTIRRRAQASTRDPDYGKRSEML